jgi:hypothetical protein
LGNDFISIIIILQHPSNENILHIVNCAKFVVVEEKLGVVSLIAKISTPRNDFCVEFPNFQDQPFDSPFSFLGKSQFPSLKGCACSQSIIFSYSHE